MGYCTPCADRAIAQASLTDDPPPLPSAAPRHERPPLFNAPQTVRGQLAIVPEHE